MQLEADLEKQSTIEKFDRNYNNKYESINLIWWGWKKCVSLELEGGKKQKKLDEKKDWLFKKQEKEGKKNSFFLTPVIHRLIREKGGQ